MRFCLISLCLLCFGLRCFAQDAPRDSTAVNDSIFVKKGDKIETIESYAKRFDPHKALLYSAVLPGAGQIYNRKYWKVPLVYGGFAIFISVITFYQAQEIKYRGELFSLIGSTSTTSASGLTLDQLRNIVNISRRQRDYFTIFAGMWYLLQMVDAHVDAHLKEFDLNPKLQVKVEPMMQNDMLTGRTTGIALKIKF